MLMNFHHLILLLISFVSYFKICTINYFQFVNFMHLLQPCYSPLGDPAKMDYSV